MKTLAMIAEFRKQKKKIQCEPLICVDQWMDVKCLARSRV